MSAPDYTVCIWVVVFRRRQSRSRSESCAIRLQRRVRRPRLHCDRAPRSFSTFVDSHPLPTQELAESLDRVLIRNWEELFSRGVGKVARRHGTQLVRAHFSRAGDIETFQVVTHCGVGQTVKIDNSPSVPVVHAVFHRDGASEHSPPPKAQRKINERKSKKNKKKKKNRKKTTPHPQNGSERGQSPTLQQHQFQFSNKNEKNNKITCQTANCRKCDRRISRILLSTRATLAGCQSHPHPSHPPTHPHIHTSTHLHMRARSQSLTREGSHSRTKSSALTYFKHTHTPPPTHSLTHSNRQTTCSGQWARE